MPLPLLLRRHFSAVASLLFVLACAPSEGAESAQASRIDGDRLVADVAALSADSMAGRLVGSAGNRAARDLIVARFTALGLTPFGDGFGHLFPVTRNGEALEGVNVVGYVPGTARADRYVVVTAHYDHLGVRNGAIFNGADDNASGTAGLLAVAAYLAQHRPRNTFVFAAVDAEEGGLSGSRAFVADPPVPLEGMALNLNMDMVSHSDGELYVSGTYHYPFLRPLVEGVPGDSGLTVLFGHDRPELGDDDWTDASDHAPFHEAGIPFLYFGVEDHPDYHRATDDVENINPAFFTRAVEFVLDVALVLDRDLDRIERESGRAP